MPSRSHTSRHTAPSCAAHVHGPHLEVVVDLGRRLVLDEPRELDGVGGVMIAAPKPDVEHHRTHDQLAGRSGAVRGLDHGNRGPPVGRGDRGRPLAAHGGQELVERRARLLGQLDPVALARSSP